MASGPSGNLLGQLRKLVAAGTVADMSDEQLLERFITQRDEAAFAALVHRHGPMVLGVCRRVLSDLHDAEDAFQATFLVLVRKAASVGRRELLANWLYGVAHRAARKAKTTAARRRGKEQPIVDLPSPEPGDAAMWRDLRPVLDDELQRLPAKYRAPVVLCYLEGKAYAEAAQQLGWPKGTLSTRLTQARELLRRRLTRRGVTLSATALATVLSPGAVSAAVPLPLIVSTSKAALALAAGQAAAAGVVSASVAALMEGVVKAMFLTKVKVVALMMLAATIVGGGAVAYGVMAANQLIGPAKEPPKTDPGQQPDSTGAPAPTKAAERPQKAPLDPEGAKARAAILKTMLEAADSAAEINFQRFDAGVSVVDDPVRWSRMWVQAQRAVSSNGAEYLQALEKHAERMRQMEEMTKRRFEKGRMPKHMYDEIQYYHAEARLWLLDTKGK
jgi:RNA polymerase sigma factor (sigma-70 family)